MFVCVCVCTFKVYKCTIRNRKHTHLPIQCVGPQYFCTQYFDLQTNDTPKCETIVLLQHVQTYQPGTSILTRSSELILP